MRAMSVRRAADKAKATPERRQPHAIPSGHYEAIVESSDDAILSKDQNLTITSWNPAAARLYGYTAEEAVGRPISILIPDDRAGEERDILKRVLDGARVDHYDTERVRKDGRRILVSLTVSPIRESDGSISGASVIARDVTAQRRAADRAARMQQLTTELAKTVEPEEVLNVALREALAALNADGGAVGLLDKDGDTIRVAGYSGYSHASLEDWKTFPLDAGLPMSETVRTGRPAWVVGRKEIVDRYPALTGAQIKFGSRAIVPLRAHGQVFGAVSLSFRETRSFEPDERAFLEAVVQQAGYALDRARLHAAEQRVRQNLDFLARASELLAQSLDVETTLQRLASFAVPRLADWCAVDLLTDGELAPVAVAHTNPAKVGLVRELQRHHPADPDAPVGAPAVIRSGRSELHADISDELLEAAAPDEESLRVLRDLGLVSAMVVPLRARAGTLGALTLAAAESERRFTSDDLEVAEDLGRRAALAVENAMLYAREHRAAVTLQRSMLPRDLPQLRGVQLAARYLPGGVGADVGGDWYDTIDLADGRLNLVVGDVAGRGIRAASVMGQLRNAFRAYVLDGCSPREAVGRLNRLARTFERSEMATLVHVSFDVRGREAECVRAGHPPPLIRGPGGEVTELAIEGSLPIGVSQGPCPTTTVRIEPGSLILMYTDGLIERRGDGIKPGLDKLKQALGTAPAEPESCLDFVLHSLTPSGSEDDVALLLMRVDRTADEPLELTMPAEPSALARIRRAVEGWLADQRIDLRDGWQIVAACNEACANASEHAYAPMHGGSIEVRARKDGPRISVAVHDHGEWRAPRGQDRGRGFTLMNYFMDRVDVERSEEGTTVRMERTLGRGNGA
jgi:PAS domain S-box-containing protein